MGNRWGVWTEMNLRLIVVLGAATIGLAGCSAGGENTSKDFQRANTVCGAAKPVRIVQHVHEFPSDNWLEVHCSDGSVRAVHGG